MTSYPTTLDTDTELYLVHDSLQLRLAEDYNPSDTSITVDTNTAAMVAMLATFPPSGFLTLTDQCSDAELRALSFTYTSVTSTGFAGLTLLPGFTDVIKPAWRTDVTMNVMAEHHNAIKDALIAIETFVGVKGDISSVPLQGSMEARTNFLSKLVLQPRAWFSSMQRVGVIPLCTQFMDFSTRQPNIWTWNFGDGTMSVISRTPTVLSGNISKCYYNPGVYDVTLTVENDYGVNTISIDNYITARVPAPDLATIVFVPTSDQDINGDMIRARTNTLITTMVSSNGQQPSDPITSYNWMFGDDLAHANSETAVASYSVGGLYDVILDVNTQLGAYRITIFPDVIDVVEQYSLWNFSFDPTAPSNAITKTLYTYEFGLISEVFKVNLTAATTSVTRDYTFLESQVNSAQQIQEFRRNNGFSPISLVSSGDHGSALLWWAEGAPDEVSTQVIRFRQYDAFDQIWTVPITGSGNDTLVRNWNWLSLASPTNVFFFLGNTNLFGSLTNQTLTTLSLNNLDFSNITFTNYQNGADELEVNVGGGTDGNFSVYRGTWYDPYGFWLRNDGTGVYFRLASFYGTQGIPGTPIQTIFKLTDIPGSPKFEGEMVSLASGVYFFNNTGEVSIYSPVANVWTVAGPGASSPAFTALQDTTVPGYANPANTLVAASDLDHNAYLSYDYSPNAFLKYNDLDGTFMLLPPRPNNGEQFLMGIY